QVEPRSAFDRDGNLLSGGQYEQAPAAQGIGQELPLPVPAAELGAGTRDPNAPGGVDEQVFQAQAAGDGAKLPPAKEPPGGANVPADAPIGEPVVPTDKLKTGPNAVGLTVEVKAPAVANFNLDTTFQIRVRNSGPTE